MHDQNIREVEEALPPLNIAPLLASLAEIIVDDLPLGKVLQRLVDVLHRLHRDRKIVEQLLHLANAPAALAFHLRAHLAPEHPLNKLLPPTGALLELVEHHIQKLLSVLLDRDINGMPSMVLKSKAESKRVVIGAVAELQEPEHPSQLVNRVFVELDLVPLPVLVNSRLPI